MPSTSISPKSSLLKSLSNSLVAAANELDFASSPEGTYISSVAAL